MFALLASGLAEAPIKTELSIAVLNVELSDIYLPANAPNTALLCPATFLSIAATPMAVFD